MSEILNTNPSKPVVSERGYYYDLSQSPFKVMGVNHEQFIFPSAKKVEMFLRDYDKRKTSLELLLSRVEKLSGQKIELTDEMLTFITHDLYDEMKRKF